MRYIVFIIAIAFYYGCGIDKKTVHIGKSGNIVIIDSCYSSVQTACLDSTESDYPIYYLGEPKDTIMIGRRYFERWTTWNWSEKALRMSSINYTDKNLTLEVDTAFHTVLSNEHFSMSGNIIPDSTENYKALLVKISNISDSTIYLGSSFSLYHMYLEIKNDSGVWVKATQKFSEQGVCMSSRATILLNPSNIIFAKVKLHQGDTIAEFRLAFGKYNRKIFSNTYIDSIDKKTFSALR